jgi:hypothetical protein
MTARIYFERRKRVTWYAAIVLFAVYSLTVNLATRYLSPYSSSVHSVKAIQKQITKDARRQRLADDSFNWAPPVFFIILQAPSLRAPVAPGVRVPSLLLAENLYTRPPPIG